MIGFIIQARTESTRYPNKIILPFFNGDTIISLLIDKLKNNFNLPIILATSTNSSNDSLEQIASNSSIICFRGSENDVLQRFIDAAELNKLNYIARICSDNPFIDVTRIKMLLNEFDSNPNFDYYSFFVNNTPSIKTHFGFWIEIVSLNALKKVKQLTSDPLYFEHVTNYVYNNPNNFKIRWVKEELILNPNIRMTIDTPEDFDNCVKLFKLQKQNNWSLNQLINFVSTDLIIIEKMKKQIIANTK